MKRFTEGMKVTKIKFVDGSDLVVAEHPIVARDECRDMTLVGQKGIFWVFVEVGEEGYPDRYVNTTAVQELTLMEDIK